MAFSSLARRLALPLALALLSPACSQSDSDTHDGSAGGSGAAGAAGSGGGAGSSAQSACGEGAGLTFTPGMEAKGASGLFTVKLPSITPAPPVNGTNSWVAELLDAQGSPVDGATITAKPLMPAHGHGSAITPTIMPLGGGQYRIDNLVFSMPGVWQTTLTISAASGSDTAVFSFCVPG